MTRPGETPGRFRFDMDTTKRRTLNVLGVGLIVAMCVVVALLLLRSRERAIADLQRDTKNLTTALAQYSRGTVTSVDLALIGARDSLARLELSEPAALRSELGNQVLRSNVARIGLPVLMRVLDRNGYELFSSDAQPFTTASNDRDYFRAHVARDVGLFISQPFVSRINGKWAMVFSRRLNGLNGQFIGVIVLGIPMEVFEDLFALFEVGPRGTLILADDQGTLFARRPTAPALIGKKVLRDDGALSLLRTGTDSGVRINKAPVDGLDRMLGFERVAATRLVVGVGQSVDDWLADWRRDALVSGSVTLLLGGLGLLMLIQTARHARDSAARGAQLESANDELQRRVDVDALTGLPNSMLFEDRLTHAVARNERVAERMARLSMQRLAVLFIDLDGFKPVNDSFGHAVGDIVLQETALRLRREARDTRHGGACRGRRVPAADGRCHQRGRLRDAGAAACRRAGRALRHRRTPGADLVLHRHRRLSGPRPARQARGPCRFGDVRCQARRWQRLRGVRIAHGCGCARAARPAQRSASRRRTRSARAALPAQDRCAARPGPRCGSAAALAPPAAGNDQPGGVHPDRRTLRPDPGSRQLGHRRGLQADAGLGRCGRAHARGDQRVGASASEGRSGRPHRARAGPAPVGRIQLLCEITESVAMEDIKSTQRVFEGLERIGVYLSIDDFGTGYSSLSYLRQLPAKQLKIDRSFVNDLESSSDARAIVDAVIRLAHALGLLVVAEGVETAGQRDALLQLDCDELQGFFFAAPMPAAKLLAWAGSRESEGAVDFSPSVIDDTPVELSVRRGAARPRRARQGLCPLRHDAYGTLNS